MQASKALVALSIMRITHTENLINEVILCASGVWIENLLPRTTQNFDLLKTILGNLHGIRRVCPHFVHTEPTTVLTHNKSVTRFFQTKAIPPSLCNTCDFVLHFNFRKDYNGGSVKTAADFLSRLELKVTEKIRL